MAGNEQRKPVLSHAASCEARSPGKPCCKGKRAVADAVSEGDRHALAVDGNFIRRKSCEIERRTDSVFPGKVGPDERSRRVEDRRSPFRQLFILSIVPGRGAYRGADNVCLVSYDDKKIAEKIKLCPEKRTGGKNGKREERILSASEQSRAIARISSSAEENLSSPRILSTNSRERAFP